MINWTGGKLERENAADKDWTGGWLEQDKLKSKECIMQVLHTYVHLRDLLTELGKKLVIQADLDELMVNIDKIHEDIKKEMRIEFNKNKSK